MISLLYLKFAVSQVHKNSRNSMLWKILKNKEHTHKKKINLAKNVAWKQTNNFYKQVWNLLTSTSLTSAPNTFLYILVAWSAMNTNQASQY